jgi:hypothetical protein
MRWEGPLLLVGEVVKVAARMRGVAAGMGGELLIGDGVGRGIDVDEDWVTGLELLLTVPAERLRRRIWEMGPRLEIVPDERGAVCEVLDGIWRAAGRPKLRRRL